MGREIEGADTMNIKQGIQLGVWISVLLTGATLYANPLNQQESTAQESSEQVEVDPSRRSVPMKPTDAALDVQWGLPEEFRIIDRHIAHVTGDQSEDVIYLVGRKENAAYMFTKEFELLVEDGSSHAVKKTDFGNLGGYEPQLFVGDFTGDGTAEVMLTTTTGGSGGVRWHRIVDFTKHVPEIIFDKAHDGGVRFTGKYENGFAAKLHDLTTGLTLTLDLHEFRDRLVGDAVYDEDGKLQIEVKPLTYPYSLLQPIDLDHDGAYELKGVQRIVGRYNADRIAYVDSLWKYQSKVWQPVGLAVTTNSGQAIQVAGYSLSEQQLQLADSQIRYPRLENMMSVLTMGMINTEIDHIVQAIAVKTKDESRINVDYQITRMDDNLFSVVFEGEQRLQAGTTQLLHAVTMDIRSRTPITAANLVKPNRAARDAISRLIAESAAQISSRKITPQPFGEWMGVYVTQSHVVFYYRETDQALNYTKVSVPLEKAKPFLNERFTITG